jgi:HAD superfamily hydrolase (TIGR01549 family)/HAD superfamily hydrolase (TIGR01509 family)
MTIQAVFFDMGGTLERFWFTRESRLLATPGLNQLLLSAGINLGLSDLELLEVVSAGHLSYHKLSITTNEELPPARVWSEFIFKSFPIDQKKLADIAEELSLYFEKYFYQREMRVEVPSVLSAIQKMGMKIGLISNVNSKGQVPTSLDQYQIKHFFNPIVLSSEYGRRKPDPAIFHYAASLANVPTSECVYIGDRIARDIVGATRAGFGLAVQITHGFDHGEPDDGAEPDAIISDLNPLVEILRSITSQQKSKPISNQKMNKSIRALLFDAGDILYYRPRKRKHLIEFLKQLGLEKIHVNENERKTLEQQAFQGQISHQEYKKAIIGLHGITKPDQIREGIKVLEQEDNDIDFFEGVRETLYLLKEKGFLLGVITDTAAPLNVKISWFEKGGFGDVWDAIITSKEKGFRKPDPRIYQAALHQLGVTAEEAVFIGHKISELDGAKTVGIKTIAFNYEDGAVADSYISQFSELFKHPFLGKEGSLERYQVSL